MESIYYIGVIEVIEFALLLLIVVGISLIWGSRYIFNHLGLSEGKLIYSDSHQEGVVIDPFYSKTLGVVGKPDYVFLRRGMYIPVDVKSVPKPFRGAYQSHIIQVAAYCYLIEEQYGVRPKYGIIKYRDGSHKVNYCDNLEQSLVDTVADMRNNISVVEIMRSHNSSKQCSSCGFVQVCGDSLIDK